jgi:hypothetical protein
VEVGVVTTRDRRSAARLLGVLWRGSWTARLTLGAVALGALLLLAVPLGGSGARLMMEKLHLRGPFARWAALQTVPSMYNFTNVVRLETPGAVPAVETFWVNHYPLRAITYMRRIELARRPATLTAETRFGRLSVVTRCRTEPRDGGIDVACEAVQ